MGLCKDRLTCDHIFHIFVICRYVAGDDRDRRLQCYHINQSNEKHSQFIDSQVLLLATYNMTNSIEFTPSTRRPSISGLSAQTGITERVTDAYKEKIDFAFFSSARIRHKGFRSEIIEIRTLSRFRFWMNVGIDSAENICSHDKVRWPTCGDIYLYLISGIHISESL